MKVYENLTDHNVKSIGTSSLFFCNTFPYDGCRGIKTPTVCCFRQVYCAGLFWLLQKTPHHTTSPWPPPYEVREHWPSGTCSYATGRHWMAGVYLALVVVAALVVGQLEFAERHFLSHPVSSSVRRIRVHVHPVSWKFKQNENRLS